MVDDGEYAVVASAFWESHDQVHGHLGEWGVVVGHCDFVQGGLRPVREILILLADRTPFDVALDPGSPARPTETVENLPSGLVSARVSRQSVVVGMHDASSSSLVWRDDCLLVLVEPQAPIVYPPLRLLSGIEPGLVLSPSLS